MAEEIERDPRWESIEAQIEPSAIGPEWVEVSFGLTAFSEVYNRPMIFRDRKRARREWLNFTLEHMVNDMDAELNKHTPRPSITEQV